MVNHFSRHCFQRRPGSATDCGNQYSKQNKQLTHPATFTNEQYIHRMTGLSSWRKALIRRPALVFIFIFSTLILCFWLNVVDRAMTGQKKQVTKFNFHAIMQPAWQTDDKWSHSNRLSANHWRYQLLSQSWVAQVCCLWTQARRLMTATTVMYCCWNDCRKQLVALVRYVCVPAGQCTCTSCSWHLIFSASWNTTVHWSWTLVWTVQV